jgi:hypothetical protein
MKLIAHVVEGQTIDIRPAPAERAWMDETDNRHAYRCLPLTIANAHGWEILCPAGFSAIWNGGKGLDAVTVTPDVDAVPAALSHFGHGVLTFHVPCLFETEPGFDLMATGPINRIKDSIAPLTGLIETDWAPYTFTMNWRFTRPWSAVRFVKGEPFCHIMPVRRGEIEAVEPELRNIADNPELKLKHEDWSAKRLRFNSDLKQPGSEAQAEKWQKSYHRGEQPDGTPAPIADHQTRLKVRPFKRTP